MKTKLSLLLFSSLLSSIPPSMAALAPQVVIATGQGNPARVARATGAWDAGGRIVLEGIYQSDVRFPGGRNMVWAGIASGGFVELVGDGDSVPYYSIGVVGEVAKLGVPRIQPVIGGYQVSANYRVYVSGASPVAPDFETRVIWVDSFRRPPPLTPTFYVVNDMEGYNDGSAQFRTPVWANAILRERASTNGLDSTTYFDTESGGALQIYFNSTISDAGGSGRAGNMVWRSKRDFPPVISGHTNVVSVAAASSGLGLNFPGSEYSSLSVLGVTPQEELLWNAGKVEGTHLLRGEAGAWTTLLAPGFAAPSARFSPPDPTSPLGTVGTVGLIANGAATFAEVKYSATSASFPNRAALLVHTNNTLKLFAFEGELITSSVPGLRLGKFTPTGYAWVAGARAAFYGPVQVGLSGIPSQALLMADEYGVTLLARVNDPLPVPADVSRVVTFRYPVLDARPDGKVVFAATVEFLNGSRRDILYGVTPGSPNRYDVLLEAGSTVSFSTIDGPREGTIANFATAWWKPGTFDRILVNVDLSTAGTSAVLVLDDGIAVARVRADLAAGLLRMRWHASFGSILEAAFTLSAPTWSDAGISSARIGDEFEVQVPPTEAARFFRVRPPFP